jgi:hypothetical protein
LAQGIYLPEKKLGFVLTGIQREREIMILALVLQNEITHEIKVLRFVLPKVPVLVSYW